MSASPGPVVVDASALVALLLDAGPEGDWVAARLRGADLVAPSLLPYESANIVRRCAVAGLVSGDVAALAHADLLDLTIELWPYELLAPRAWELRHNLAMYDASYVALAERLDAALVTLDRALPRAPGLHCAVSCPPGPPG